MTRRQAWWAGFDVAATLGCVNLAKDADNSGHPIAYVVCLLAVSWCAWRAGRGWRDAGRADKTRRGRLISDASGLAIDVTAGDEPVTVMVGANTYVITRDRVDASTRGGGGGGGSGRKAAGEWPGYGT